MAKVSGSTVALGAAGLVGGLYLYAKSKGLLPVPGADSSATLLPATPILPSGGGGSKIDTTSAAYLTSVANAAQSYAAQTPGNCVQTPYGVVCPSNFNNPTLQPAPQINPPVQANNGTPVTPILAPPPPPLSVNPTTGWSNSTETEQVCDNGRLMSRPKGSGGLSPWNVIGPCGDTAPRCREVSIPGTPGVLNMDPSTFVMGLPSRFIVPPTPASVQLVCD